MDISKNVKLDQAITMAVERARFALQMAASQGRSVKVIISHLNGRIEIALSLGGDA